MHKTKLMAVVAILAVLAFATFPTSAQPSDCYIAAFTLSNPEVIEDIDITVNFSQGSGAGGIIGPQIGTVGPVPALGSASFTLSGTWAGYIPDNIVISSAQNSTINSVSISPCSSPPSNFFPSVPPIMEELSIQGFFNSPFNGAPQFVFGQIQSIIGGAFPPLQPFDRPFEIWTIDELDRGINVLSLVQEQFEEFPTAPLVNTQMASGDGWAFYVLTTGEFQINYGPTDDGWYDVVVLNRNFDVTNHYRSR